MGGPDAGTIPVPGNHGHQMLIMKKRGKVKKKRKNAYVKKSYAEMKNKGKYEKIHNTQ
jgi:hypothetical protein